MQLLFIVEFIVFFLLSLSLYSYYKMLQHRKNNLLILPIRNTIKILSLLIGSAASISIVNFPHSLILSAVFLCGIITIFSFDVIVKKEGIYFGLGLLSWEGIQAVDDHILYLMILTKNRSNRKGFLKIIWKITPENVAMIQALLKRYE